MASADGALWPPDVSGMAKSIRTYNWSATALGSITDWTSRLRLTVEMLLVNPLVAYAVCGPERILIYNDAAAAMLGPMHPGALGQSTSTFFSEARKVMEPLYDRAFAGRAIKVEAQPIDLHGRSRPSAFDLILTPIPEEDGTIANIQVVGFDVSARLAAEEDRDRTLQDLRASEARLRLALDASRAGVWTYDPDAKTFEVDARTAEVTAIAPGATLSASVIWRATHPDDRALLQARLMDMLDPQGDHWNEAFARFVHPDGTVHWTQIRAQSVLEGSASERRTVQVLGTLLDITESKQAEAALRESEQRFRAVANLGPDFLWNSDPEGRATWFSERWYAYSGQSDVEALGYGWHEVIHPEDREPTMARFFEVVKQGKVYSHEYRIRRQDGVYRWFLVRAGPVRDEAGQITQCYGAVIDIHDLHELQQQQAIMVGELQHRTRNLITVVRLIAQQTLAQTGPTERFRTCFNDRLAALSRVQGLLSRSDQQPITIRALIRAELDALGFAGVQARAVLEGPPVVLRKASVQTLALALHELATNARKYGALAGEQGELWVDWNSYTTENGQQRLSLVWLEEGISTPPEGGPIRRGYGRELIEKALPYALNARTSYSLGNSELRCEIDLPLA
jgi:PAS domain S-box-containing protein